MPEATTTVPAQAAANPEMDSLMQNVSEFRQVMEKLEGKTSEQEVVFKKFESTLEKIEKINLDNTKKEMDAQNEVKELKESLELIEKKMSRMSVDSITTSQESEQHKAFQKYLKVGFANPADLTDDDRKFLTGKEYVQKALRTDILTSGQALTSPEFVAEIIKNVKEITPVLSLARVMSTNKPSVRLRVRTSAPTFPAVGETEQNATSQSKYGTKEIKNGIFRGTSEATDEMLSDADFDIASEITMDMSEDFAFQLGNGFVLGNTGENEMQGFLNKVEIQTVDSPGGDISSDSIIELFGELKTIYQPTYILNRRTLSRVMRLKGGDGQFLWQASLQQGLPNLLNGLPYVEVPDMPDSAIGQRPIAIGDWFKAYRVLNGTGMTMLRNPFTKDDEGIVRFTGRKRQGGATVLDEAIKIMIITA